MLRHWYSEQLRRQLLDVVLVRWSTTWSDSRLYRVELHQAMPLALLWFVSSYSVCFTWCSKSVQLVHLLLLFRFIKFCIMSRNCCQDQDCTFLLVRGV